MMKIKHAIAGASLSLLVACSSTSPTPTLGSIEAALVNALTNSLAPGINAAMGDLANRAATNKDFQLVAYALPWADQALGVFGPKLGMSPSVLSGLHMAIVDAEGLMAHPPADAGQALSAALTTYNQVRAALKL